jgi:hypothetical protein
MLLLGQRIGAQAIGGAVVLITASALIWVGVAFAGYAIYVALIPKVTEPWAASAAAAILVIAPLGWAALINLHHRRQDPRPKLHHPDPRVALSSAADDPTLNLLAKVAEEKPLLAVLFAGILGASEAITHRKS